MTTQVMQERRCPKCKRLMFVDGYCFACMRDEMGPGKVDSNCITPESIGVVCDEIKALLIAKNKAYGNSAAEPLQCFSKLGALAQIDCRIDDKLSRIRNMGASTKDEDTLLDLIGYLVLRRIVSRE